MTGDKQIAFTAASLTLSRQFATHAPGIMAESSTPASGGASPAKDEVELLEILRLLIKSKKARTTSDLLKYATQYGAPEAEERLRMLEAENVPLDLAFDAISVQLRLMAHKRNSALLAAMPRAKSRSRSCRCRPISPSFSSPWRK